MAFISQEVLGLDCLNKEFHGDLRKREETDKVLNHFLVPQDTGEMGPNNSVVSIGSILDLQWLTQFQNFDLMLYQQLERIPSCESGGCVEGPYPIASNISKDHYLWTVTTGNMELGAADTFFLLARELDSDRQFGSSYMNFTLEPGHVAKGVTTSSVSTPSPTSTAVSRTVTPFFSTTTPLISTSSSSSSTNGPPASTSTSSKSSAGKPALQNLAIVGIVVGCLILLLAVMFVFWRYYRRRKSVRENINGPTFGKSELHGNPVPLHELHGTFAPQELEAKTKRKTMGPFEMYG